MKTILVFEHSKIHLILNTKQGSATSKRYSSTNKDLFILQSKWFG